MPRDNNETSPSLLELRHRAGANQSTLNIELDLQSSPESGNSSSSAAPGASVIGDASSGAVPPQWSCFLGDTPFTLHGGERIKFKKLYDEREKHKFAKSFNDKNEVVKGRILKVFRTLAYEYLFVTFSDGSQVGVKPNHKYFSDGQYVPISELQDEFVSGVQVLDLKPVKNPKGAWMYNATIKEYANYEADGKRVSNLKEPDIVE